MRDVDAIRMLVLDIVQTGGGGHAGTALGAAPVALTLFANVMMHDPGDPRWPDRDRFVLSAGHAAALLYAMLHVTGYERPTAAELARFRQWGAATPGHPEYRWPEAAEMTSGPLGQGFATGVGMALAAERLAAEFNRPGHEIVSHRVFGLLSDGDLHEGVSYEAAAIAGHLKLGRIVYVYDANATTIDGPAAESSSENVANRFLAAGWHVESVSSNEEIHELRAALGRAIDDSRPSLVIAPSIIGAGVPGVEGTSAAHGGPYHIEAVQAARERVGWHRLPFDVPGETRRRLDQRKIGAARSQQWRDAFVAYKHDHWDLAAEFERRVVRGDLPTRWDDNVRIDQHEPTATRKHAGNVLQQVAGPLPELFGGSADLATATNICLAGGVFSATDRSQRNVRFGVREHAMAAIANGMALEGGIVPFISTFLAFTDYLRPALRLAAMMRLRVLVLASHDSIAVGENGPTHQPVEQLAGLRALPGCQVLRPADGDEVIDAFRAALRYDGPSVIALSRQPVGWLGDKPRDVGRRGGYVLQDRDDVSVPDVLLIATGAEVALCCDAARLLAEQDISARVVSLPSWEQFTAQPASYRESVIMPDVRARVAVEAASPLGWAQWVGDHGRIVAVCDFGASAPGAELLDQFGLTAGAVAEAARASMHDVAAARA